MSGNDEERYIDDEHIYPPFSDLENYIGVDISSEMPDDITEERACFLLARLLTDFIADEKPLHGIYQIIFYCLDKGFCHTARDFYRQMTTQQDGEDMPWGDPTNAFVYYCIENNYHGALAFVLQNDMYETDQTIERLPIEYINMRLGIIV